MKINRDIEEYNYIDEGVEVLSDLPIDLIRENIFKQIEEPHNETNNIEIVLEKLEYVTSIYQDQDTLFQVKDVKQEFLYSILNHICKEYDLDCNVDEDDLDELEEITCALYDALIIHYKKNMSKFFLNYILDNKDDLVKEYQEFIEKRDLSGLSYKESNTNLLPDDYIILVSLPLIMKSIYDLNRDVDPEYFLKISGCSLLYSGSTVLEAFESGTVYGSFVNKYMNLLTDELGYQKPEIYESVKMALINRFRARSI